jgi:hypothetical protein
MIVKIGVLRACSGFLSEKPRSRNPCGAWAAGSFRGFRGFISTTRKFFKYDHRGQMSYQGYQQKKISSDRKKP